MNIRQKTLGQTNHTGVVKFIKKKKEEAKKKQMMTRGVEGGEEERPEKTTKLKPNAES